jgi:pyruvate kinase
MEKPPFHRTKIVATLGPSTDRPGILPRLLDAGLDVARINAVHGSPETHTLRIQAARAAAAKAGLPIAILMDLPGPKFRLGHLRSPSLILRHGEEVFLGEGPSEEVLPVAELSFLKDLRPGDPVYLADGTVRLVVLRASKDQARCRVEFGGTIRSGSGLNLPTSKLSVRLPTADDRRWIDFACEHAVEWLGMSFVRSVQDIRNVRRRLAGRKHKPLLMAKIEKREALANLGAIVDAADGLMVARGDLGVETPLETVPLAQKRIIHEAITRGKPVVTATQMLESMVEHSSPTRAEVADVANAVLDGTDCVMLSAETAIGQHPVEAVKTLTAVIGATESDYPFGAVLQRLSQTTWTSVEDAVCLAAARLSFDLDVAAIVISGDWTPAVLRIAAFRPRAPILVVARSTAASQAFNAVWNVRPVVGSVPERARPAAIRRLLRPLGLGRAGQSVLFVATGEQRPTQVSDSLQVIRL